MGRCSAERRPLRSTSAIWRNPQGLAARGWGCRSRSLHREAARLLLCPRPQAAVALLGRRCNTELSRCRPFHTLLLGSGTHVRAGRGNPSSQSGGFFWLIVSAFLYGANEGQHAFNATDRDYELTLQAGSTMDANLLRATSDFFIVMEQPSEILVVPRSDVKLLKRKNFNSTSCTHLAAGRMEVVAEQNGWGHHLARRSKETHSFHAQEAKGGRMARNAPSRRAPSGELLLVLCPMGNTRQAFSADASNQPGRVVLSP